MSETAVRELVRMQAQQRETESDRPEGDDTWRQYHKRGEA